MNTQSLLRRIFVYHVKSQYHIQRVVFYPVSSVCTLTDHRITIV